MSEILRKNSKLLAIRLMVCGLMLICASNCLAKMEITRIQAKLYYQNTGKFSDDVFTTPSDLWNVAFDYVYSVFVVVELEASPKDIKTSREEKLVFVARYIPREGSKREIVVRRSAPIWFLPDSPEWFKADKHKTFVGFWIDNVGCDPIKLSAKIRGQKTLFRKTIPFGCGE